MAWQTLQYLANPTSYLTSAQRRHGDIFTARLLSQDWVVIADPAAIRTIFSAPHDQLRGGEASRVLEPLIGTRNLLMLDGDEYLHRRRLLLPALHGKAIRQQEAMIRDAARSELDRWPTGKPFAVLPRLQELAATIIEQCVLGQPADELMTAVLDLLRWLTNTRRLAYYFTLGAQRLIARPGYQRRQHRVDQQISRLIATQRHDDQLHSRTDILSLLLRAVDHEGQPLAEQDIHDEILTLLVAGHENTAATLAWATHELARSPAAQDQLAADPDTWSSPLLNETLRLRPPVPLVPRRLATPITLANRTLPAGTNVAPCALLAQRDPRLHPQPLAFRPQRFLDAQPAAWLPYGGGTRRCIGDALAQTESRIILQEIIARYHLRPAGPPERARPRALVLVPSHGSRIVALNRELR